MKQRRIRTIGIFMTAFLAIYFTFSPAVFAKPIEITINDHNPEVSGAARSLKYWAEQTQALLGDKAKITVHYGGALLKGDEAYRGIQSGVADGGHYVMDRRDGFLLNSIITLPFMGYPDQRGTAKIYRQLISEFPEMAAEYKGVTIIGLIMMPPTGVHTVKKTVIRPSDLKGLKIYGAEYATVEAAGAAGATPVQMDITDMYMSLDRGLIDGILQHVPVLMVFRVLDLVKKHTFFGEGGINKAPMMVIMYNEKLNAMPADVKQILLGSGHFWEDRIMEIDLGMQKEGVEICKKKGDELIYLTPEQIKSWYDLMKDPIHNKWINECEAKKLPAQKVYDRALSLIKQ